MSEKLISFIIPAHNSGKTLEACVCSILDCDEISCVPIEILIIENGSADHTRDIADRLANQWDQVRVFTSAQGVSCARNVGIQNASGRWISFVDADDRILPGKVSVLIRDAINSDSDLMLYGHRAGRVRRSVTDSSEIERYRGQAVVNVRVRMLENPTRYMQVWAKLFRREIIERHGIRFHESLRLSEDSDFTLRYTRCCSSICLSSEIIYDYVLNHDSTMRSFDGTKLDAYVYAMHETWKNVADDDLMIQDAFQSYILIHLNIAMVREVFAVQNRSSMIQKYKKMNQTVSKDIFRQAIRAIPLSKCNSARMLPVLLFKLKLNPLAAVVFCLRAVQNNRREKMGAA